MLQTARVFINDTLVWLGIVADDAVWRLINNQTGLRSSR